MKEVAADGFEKTKTKTNPVCCFRFSNIDKSGIADYYTKLVSVGRRTGIYLHRKMTLSVIMNRGRS